MAQRNDVEWSLKPWFELKICLFCTMPTTWKKDKYGQPYISCSACSARLFCHSESLLAGIELIQKYQQKMGLSFARKHIRQMVDKRAKEAMRSA